MASVDENLPMALQAFLVTGEFFYMLSLFVTLINNNRFWCPLHWIRDLLRDTSLPCPSATN